MSLIDYYNTGDDSLSVFGGLTWLGQTFTASESYSINFVRLKLYRIGFPGTITVSIRATSGGKPTGGDLNDVTGTTNGDALTDDLAGEWITIALSSSISLTEATKYAIVIRAVATGGYWRRDGTSPTYTGGNIVNSPNGGSIWGDSTVSDYMFETYSGISAPTDKTYSKKLIAIGNHRLEYESSSGTMSELAAATGTINTDELLMPFEAFQKIFIANKSNLKVADFGNVKITTSDIGSHPPDKGNILTGGTSGAKMVVDYITALTSACTIYGQKITTATFSSGETVTGTDDDGNAISFNTSAAEVAGPHWYNWTVYGNSTTYGIMPEKATLDCLYCGRAVLSGNPQYPNQWYMSKIANLWDFNYSSTDALSAVAGNNADAGEIGDIVVSLSPYKDDFIIFGCANSLWVLIGDPASGGSINELDLTTGIFGPKAWCFDDAGNWYFWGTSGIYKSEYTGGRPSKPRLLTELSLPKIIQDEQVDQSLHRIVLAYDRDRRGILICITTLADGTNSNYFFDLRTGGFFPESSPSACGAFSLFYYDAIDDAYRTLLIGCNDGYIRKFDETATNDDSGASDTAISSYCSVVQLLGDGEDNEGKLLSLTPILAGQIGDDTSNVSYEYHVGDDAEAALDDMMDGVTAKESGTLSGTGRQNRIRKKLRGAYLGLKLYNNTASQTWAVDKIIAKTKIVGKIKGN